MEQRMKFSATPQDKTIQQSARHRALFALALASVMALAGCGKNDDNEEASVRVTNLTVESGAISIRIEDEDTQWQSNIAVGTTTAFKDIESGSKRVRVSNAGGVILDQNLQMNAKQKQMLLVYGGASSLGMSLVNNDIASAASGKTRLRILNAAVGLGTYDIYLTKSGEDYRTIEPKVRNSSGTTYEEDAGTYSIILTTPNSKDVLFQTTTPRTLNGQNYYNLVLYNLGSGELPNAFWLRQDDDAAPEILNNPIARLRVANTQSAVSSTNVSVDGTRVFTNVTTSGVSTYIKTASGNRTVTFSDGSSAQALASLTQSFTGGRDYSVFLAANPAGGSPIAFRTLDTTLPPSAGKLRVRLVNASTAPDLALALSFTTVTPNIAVQSASNYVEVTGGDGTPVTITQGAAAIPVISLSGTDLTNARTYSIIVGGVPGALQLSIRQDS
jgi:hypothetical protein